MLPPCSSTSCLHQRQADAQPALRRSQRRGRPARTGRTRAAAAPARCRCRCRARVTTASLPCALGAQPMRPPSGVYLAALFSRLRQHLRQPRRIAVARQHRLRAARHGERAAPRVDQRPARLDRAVDDRRRGRRAPCAARSCPAVMRETSSRSSTRRDSCATCRSMTRARPIVAVAVGRAAARICSGVADRRQRVAQLVRQHREELVLAPVGLASSSSTCLRWVSSSMLSNTISGRDLPPRRRCAPRRRIFSPSPLNACLTSKLRKRPSSGRTLFSASCSPAMSQSGRPDRRGTGPRCLRPGP